MNNCPPYSMGTAMLPAGKHKSCDLSERHGHSFAPFFSALYVRYVRCFFISEDHFHGYAVGQADDFIPVKTGAEVFERQ